MSLIPYIIKSKTIGKNYDYTNLSNHVIVFQVDAERCKIFADF